MTLDMIMNVKVNYYFDPLGYVWSDEKGGVGWEGMELLKFPLFEYKINGWNGIGEDGMDSIQFHYINSFNFRSNLEGMG